VHVVDIETDGIEATKIHCLVFYDINTKVLQHITDYDEIREYLSKEETLIIHNGIRYDKPTLERILNIKINNKIVDTLGLSWALNTKFKKHGLEMYGEFFGVKKPQINDWENLEVSTYIHRCTEDVKINVLTWLYLKKILDKLYTNEEIKLKYIDHINFKLDCVQEQEHIGIKFDIEKAKNLLTDLKNLKNIKEQELIPYMLPVPVYTKIKKRVKIVDGETIYYKDPRYKKFDIEPIELEEKIFKGNKEPSASSIPQIKNWLFSLGWEPDFYKKNDKGEDVPQISYDGDDKQLSESVLLLADKNPEIRHLEGMSILTSRIGSIENMLNSTKNGRVYASIGGFSNTLRMKHKGVVNLTSVKKPYGKEIRSLFLADNIFCGTDLSGIEDNTKRHFIFKYDPDYVREMSSKSFDPHLDIAIKAGFLTEKQAEAHKKKEEDYTSIRQKAKTANFALTYKCSYKTLALQTKLNLSKAKLLYDTYWKRNKAILDIERDLKVKEVDGTKWILNPVNNFYYSLRTDKDKFSVLNQGTAAYVFDLFLKNLRNRSVLICYQCHDEFLADVKNNIDVIINDSINELNESLKLNVTIRCESKYGYTYADCH
jgi:DNA polymerase I-like protein with 3'-5' exonuclease and polymerase domains